jgi:hypothetical protein
MYALGKTLSFDIKAGGICRNLHFALNGKQTEDLQDQRMKKVLKEMAVVTRSNNNVI